MEQDIIIKMFEAIGEDPTRDGLLDTPNRVVKMWKEIYRGYDDKQLPKLAIFPNNADGIKYDEMVIDEGKFYSQCEHHMVPFFGDYYFAYIPKDKILGLSKVARVVSHFSAKLQIQERLVKEVVDYLEKELDPLGIALVMQGRHLCKEMRGAKMIGGMMTTSDLRGVFRTDDKVRLEFLSLINK